MKIVNIFLLFFKLLERFWLRTNFRNKFDTVPEYLQHRRERREREIGMDGERDREIARGGERDLNNLTLKKNCIIW